MEWPILLLIFLGGLIFLMLLGIPVAYSFLLIECLTALFFWDFETGMRHITQSMYSVLSSWALLPITLFVLMGEVMFLSGIAPRMIAALDKWMGRLPGRLALLSVGAGALLSTLSGTSIGSIAVLGKVLLPEMEKHRYKPTMMTGPILGSGCLAIYIPPSAMGVFVAIVAEVSVGKLLLGIIIPGLMLAILYASYIIIMCFIQPSLAPSYVMTATPLSEKIVLALKYILPLGSIVFLVVGSIFVGLATPTEAAALGTCGTFVLAAFYRGITWDMTKKVFRETLRITVMILIIVASARIFTNILAFSGASRGMSEWVVGLPVPPLVIVIIMFCVQIFLGGFMAGIPLIAITVPVFTPVVKGLGFDPLWFAIISLISVEISQTSPPFGIGLFVMRGVTPEWISMGDIVKSAIPYLLFSIFTGLLIIFIPEIVLWFPSLID